MREREESWMTPGCFFKFALAGRIMEVSSTETEKLVTGVIFSGYLEG